MDPCDYIFHKKKTTAAAVEQWVRAFAPQAEGLVFEFQQRQT